MPMTNFSELFDPAEQSQAIDLVGRIFGDIVSLASGEETGYTTWLSAMVQLFNFAGLFGIMVVSLYTVLTVFFDTAKDGQPFGNQADARYTMIRVVSGAMAFIPIKGGFSIAQLVLIWLAIQGSALGDTGWTVIADQNLQGKSFIGASRFTRPGDERMYIPAENTGIDFRVRQQMAVAFDALVTGFLCRNAMNSVDAYLAGRDNVSQNYPVAFVKPPSFDRGIQENYWGLGDPSLNLTHAIYFKDVTGKSYSGSQQICGGISRNVTEASGIEAAFSSGYNVNTDYFQPLRAMFVIADMKAYHDAMVGGASGGLAGKAEAVAKEIWDNSATDDEIRRMAVKAVDDARVIFVTRSSAEAKSIYSDERLGAVAAQLRDKVTMDGWVMAAAWQNGLSRAAAEARRKINFKELDLEIAKENNIKGFVAPAMANFGPQKGNQATSVILADQTKAVDAAQSRWVTIAPAVYSATNGAAADAPTSMLNTNGGGNQAKGVVAKVYSVILNSLAVREPEDAYNDPLVDVKEFGDGMLEVGGMIVAGGFLADFYLGNIPTVGSITGFVTTIGYGFLAVGFAASALIPMLPIVYFYSAVISWLILIVESMFALPLAILSLFTPSRDGTLIGSWNRILLSIFGIFLRPLFTVAGLLFGMLLMAVALDFSNALFQSVLGILSPTGSISSLFTMLGVVLVSTMVTFYTVLLGSSMITEIGDGAMSLFGIGLSQVGGRMNVGDKMHGQIGEKAMPTSIGPANRPNLMARDKAGHLLIKQDLRRLPGIGSNRTLPPSP